jgi:hypothetical protein
MTIAVADTTAIAFYKPELAGAIIANRAGLFRFTGAAVSAQVLAATGNVAVFIPVGSQLHVPPRSLS